MTDTFSITAFRNFCLGKGDEAYNCTNKGQCALAQFGYPDILRADLDRVGIPESVYDAIFGFGLGDENVTFARLAFRLDTLIEGGGHG
jgi:hypothetical protein